MDKSGMVGLLILAILVIWLYTSGRLAAISDVLGGRRGLSSHSA